jgi:Uma2 family endonuclease
MAVSAPGVIFSEDEAMAPDVAWVRRERLAIVIGEDGKLHAAPDLAVEVLSPGKQNESRDRKIKPARYAFWGVPEYWLVDRFSRTVEVYRLTSAAYAHIATLGADAELTSPLMPGFACPVAEFFADLT